MKKIIILPLIVSSSMLAITEVEFGRLQADYNRKKAGYLADPITNASAARGQLNSIRSQIASTGKNSRWTDRANAWVDTESDNFENAYTAASSARRPASTVTPTTPSTPRTPAGLPAPTPAGSSTTPAGLPAPSPAGLPSPTPAGLPAPTPAGLPAPEQASQETQQAIVNIFMAEFNTAQQLGDLQGMQDVKARLESIFNAITYLTPAQKQALSTQMQTAIDAARIPVAPAAAPGAIGQGGGTKDIEEAKKQLAQLRTLSTQLENALKDWNEVGPQEQTLKFMQNVYRDATQLAQTSNRLSQETKNAILTPMANAIKLKEAELTIVQNFNKAIDDFNKAAQQQDIAGMRRQRRIAHDLYVDNERLFHKEQIAKLDGTEEIIEKAVTTASYAQNVTLAQAEELINKLFDWLEKNPHEKTKTKTLMRLVKGNNNNQATEIKDLRNLVMRMAKESTDGAQINAGLQALEDFETHNDWISSFYWNSTKVAPADKVITKF